MNIVVTGASGFVGKNLVPYLMERDQKVIPITRSARFAYTDVTDNFLDEQNVNAIVHLAGKAHDLNKSVNPEEYYQVNRDLTIQLFDAFIRSSAEVFIYISSVKAVADHANNSLTEDAIPLPVTDYGKSKLAAEQYILAQPLSSDKRVYILRPCMIHGPGNKGNLNLLYKVAKLGIPYPLASFENQRSFLSIDNLCFVVKELMCRTDIPSGIYNLSDDSPISTNRVIEIMSETIRKRSRLWKIDKRLINCLARIGDFLPLPLNTERLHKLTESYVVSNAKLLAVIKKKLPVSSEDGLQRTIQSFMEVK